MIAATHFDPVVGIDIHIVQPPGPVPPIPVPHPFVGMVIDPMEYAPYIGGTVMVNGMMRGTAGTGGKGIPAARPHRRCVRQAAGQRVRNLHGKPNRHLRRRPGVATRPALAELPRHRHALADPEEAAHQAEVARTADLGGARGAEGHAGLDRRPADDLAHGDGDEVRHGRARPLAQETAQDAEGEQEVEGRFRPDAPSCQRPARSRAGRPAPQEHGEQRHLFAHRPPGRRRKRQGDHGIDRHRTAGTTAVPLRASVVQQLGLRRPARPWVAPQLRPRPL